MKSWLADLWHRRLGKRILLARPVDEGSGPVVVLLHGVGRSAAVWKPLVEQLDGLQCRVVAFDLLGFGSSPKPQGIDYSVDDHALAVIASIKKLHSRSPIVLVGHSMGGLVAVRVARLRPDLIKQLILYEMPLYKGLPNKRSYRWRLEAYFRLYDQIIAIKTIPGSRDTIGERLVKLVAGFDADADTWQPFVKSLKNTIVNQSADEDIRHLDIPTDVIYGSLDMLVIRGKVKQMFGSDSEHITTHTIRERHKISKKAGSFLTERISVALEAGTDNKGHSRLKDILGKSKN